MVLHGAVRDDGLSASYGYMRCRNIIALSAFGTNQLLLLVHQHLSAGRHFDSLLAQAVESTIGTGTRLEFLGVEEPKFEQVSTCAHEK